MDDISVPVLVGRLEGRLDSRLDAQDKVLAEIRDHTKRTNGRVTTIEKERIAEKAVASERERAEAQRKADLAVVTAAADRKSYRREWKVGAAIATASVLVTVIMNLALHSSTPAHAPEAAPHRANPAPKTAMLPKTTLTAGPTIVALVRPVHKPAAHRALATQPVKRAASVSPVKAPVVAQPKSQAPPKTPHPAPASRPQPVASHASAPADQTRTTISSAVRTTGTAVAAVLTPVAPQVADSVRQATNTVAQVAGGPLPAH